MNTAEWPANLRLAAIEALTYTDEGDGEENRVVSKVHAQEELTTYDASILLTALDVVHDDAADIPGDIDPDQAEAIQDNRLLATDIQYQLAAPKRAYKQGRDAGVSLKDRDENPYQGTELAGHWGRGWEHGRDVAEDHAGDPE